MNGRDAGLKLCLDCHRTCSLDEVYCPRCGARVHIRQPNSIARSWALTIAAALLYIPANLLPMMTVGQFGKGKPETIMSGVIELVNHGMVPIALLVFTASVLVPLLKLLGMLWLLMTYHLGQREGISLRMKMRLYRLIVWIGRWSMLDIFIISLLTGLVQFGQVGHVAAEPGVWAFSAVVVITMFAAISFDPRLLWDVHAISGLAHSRRRKQ